MISAQIPDRAQRLILKAPFMGSFETKPCLNRSHGANSPVSCGDCSVTALQALICRVTARP